MENKRIIRLPFFKKKIEELTCKEAAKMVIPYIEEQLCDKDLRKFVKHIQRCPECREELETYYIVYKGLMQLDEKEELPMNIIEALNEDLDISNLHLRNMSLFYVLSEVLAGLVNLSCLLLLLERLLEFILGV